MEIAKIKIKNEIMSEICNSLFSNRNLTENHNSFFSNCNITENCNSNTIIPIPPKIILRFFNEYQKQHQFTLNKTYPYISLISDNAANELQIYIKKYDTNSKKK